MRGTGRFSPSSGVAPSTGSAAETVVGRSPIETSCSTGAWSARRPPRTGTSSGSTARNCCGACSATPTRSTTASASNAGPRARVYDLLIVGCGPVGAVAANLAGAAGLSTCVVERGEDVFDLPRAIHFDAHVMRILQQAGVADEVLPATRVWKRSTFYGA